jgi:hypothetical protein
VVHYTESDLEPLPPWLRRLWRAAIIAISAVACAGLLGAAAYVALIRGWHPIPSTGLGCGLHMKFHSANSSPVKWSDSLLLRTDCLNVTILGQETILRDSEKIAAVGAWLDSRSDRWVENFLLPFQQSKPLIVIRQCQRPPGTDDVYLYLDDDWVGSSLGKRFQRPICRGEWREMAAIFSASGANR